MSGLPDLSAHGYRVAAILGDNPEGGRTTYRATRLDGRGEAVVIKRFSFASAEASWQGYQAHEREIAVLRSLEHPRIPAYIGDFQTADGFCLVQAFCDAPAMSARRAWSLAEIGRVARSILEALIYLQRRAPPLIHRDIKPENILVDDRERAHLVDFGLARIERSSNTTLAVGTPGYMPPEQLLGRALSEATDLYAVGATLMVALTGTPSHRVGDLVDDAFQFDLDRLPRSVGPAFRRWLGRMVAPRRDDRFATARQALAALKAIGPLTADTAQPAAPRPQLQPHEPSARTGGGPNRSSVGLAAGVGVMAAVGAISFLVVSSGQGSEVTAGDGPGEPIFCDTRMELARDLDTDQQMPAINALPGCELTVRDRTIRAPIGIVVAKGATAVLERATIETGRSPIEVKPGGELEVRDSILTTSDGTRAAMIRGGRVQVLRSELSSAHFAIDVSGDARVEVVESELTGGKAALAMASSTGEVIVRRSILSGPQALRILYGEVTIDGGTLDGGIAVDPSRGRVLGLDSAKLVLGDAAEETWVQMVCAPVAVCVQEIGALGEYVSDIRVPIDAQGQPEPIEWLQVKLDPRVRDCVTARIGQLRLAEYDGKPRSARCTITGNLGAGGATMEAVHSRFEPGP